MSTTYIRSAVGAYAVRNTQTRTTQGRTWYSPIPFISVKLVAGSWLFTWAAGTGPVRVVLWGNIIDTITDNFYNYPAHALYASPTMAPPLEVWPGGVRAVSERNKPFVVLQWYRVPCHHYRIEYFNGTGWVFFTTVSDTILNPVVTLTTPILPDEALTKWRVYAVDVNKRQSPPLTFTYTVGRPPDVPAIPTLACTGGVLTVQ